ncbi:4-amino-4-deoxy-L-arabinose-phosphoundecaprenol flippase subunit ArnF [Atlantibacter hermannii]|nr:4-amino-4-deoxy-L-arabinose-phosphoundecaprenol flippase subunit ArnF [Atlantibacter hermannii]
MKGYFFAAASVALVSVAQLLLRWAMMHLPAFDGAGLNVLLAAPLPSARACGRAYRLWTIHGVLALRIALFTAKPCLSAVEPELCAGVGGSPFAAFFP